MSRTASDYQKLGENQGTDSYSEPPEGIDSGNMISNSWPS